MIYNQELNILFWNVGGQDVNEDIVDLIISTSSTLVILAEYKGNVLDIISMLTCEKLNFHEIPQIACDRITILTSIPLRKITHKHETNRYTIKEFRINESNSILIGMVHFLSKLHADEDMLANYARVFKADLETVEKATGHKNSIVIGDFNMNPFEKGMVSAFALNSVPTLAIAKRNFRLINGIEHSFFYNPTWKFLSEIDNFSGTYFHKSPNQLSHYWNVLDQVILRPSAAEKFKKESLTILKETGKRKLIGKNGSPSVSDHLPIFFSLST